MKTDMKKIGVLIPTYNEEDNVVPLAEAIIGQFAEHLSGYDYEILFIDNDSKDKTRERIAGLCKGDKKIKAIFNSKNFGPGSSGFYGLLQTSGDCVIGICADFQDPPELIPAFVKEWENGYKIVLGVKTKSKENPLMRLIRSIYYKMIKKMSDIEQLEHVTGFGLFDRTVVEIMASFADPMPYVRGMITEIGFKRKLIPYTQQKRRAGKSSYNFYRYYDTAMLSFTSYTKVGLRIAVFFGFIVSFLSFLAAFVYLVLKLIFWDSFPAGNIPILLGVFVLGGLQIFFIGLVGEYILSINARLMKRPYVIEEERINFEDPTEGK
jgi:glycosyltransferase involved in cell wall biosynthesis